jgi:hypothetical protein
VSELIDGLVTLGGRVSIAMCYMEGIGVPGYTRGDGVSINMEMPPAGGRHRQTSSCGTSPDLKMTPRDMLVQEIRDARRIYKGQLLYI